MDGEMADCRGDLVVYSVDTPTRACYSAFNPTAAARRVATQLPSGYLR